jgi:HEPN domain-containing protein
MSPAEDAALLLRIVRRHLQAMRLNLDPDYPDEEWGFQAQQALEKLLKAQLVLADQLPARTHELALLADQLGEPLPQQLLELQVYAVEARYGAGPFALKTPRQELLALLDRRLTKLEGDLKG